jgi:hypothetical protein
VDHSPGPGHDGAFAEVFSSGPDADGAGWYLKLLGLRPDGPRAVQVVARCLGAAGRPRDEIEALLAVGTGWREHLVGCVAALVADPVVRPTDAVTRAASSYSWASPQVLVTATLIGTGDWAARAGRAIVERSDPKAAAALAALVSPVSPQVGALAEQDVHGGADIARRWQRKIGTAFDDAGLHRSW